MSYAALGWPWQDPCPSDEVDSGFFSRDCVKMCPEGQTSVDWTNDPSNVCPGGGKRIGPSNEKYGRKWDCCGAPTPIYSPPSTSPPSTSPPSPIEAPTCPSAQVIVDWTSDPTRTCADVGGKRVGASNTIKDGDGRTVMKYDCCEIEDNTWKWVAAGVVAAVVAYAAYRNV